jgi:gamma-glutamylcyclotransferase (GGCT)/AIG2-like uncharacterized protein YtfP
MNLLFVYGTLKRGYGNNRLLYGAEFIGEGITKKSYHLHNCGFPKAVPSITGLPVKGEVFRVEPSHITRCDMLEGHPDWYTRREIIANVNGEDVPVMIYEMDTPSQSPLCNTNSNEYYYWDR